MHLHLPTRTVLKILETALLTRDVLLALFVGGTLQGILGAVLILLLVAA